MCKAVSGKSKEELLSVAQEIAFAKALASNDKSLRDRALKKLKRWFSIKSSQDSVGIRFTEEGFMRLWKGLFYCVWMSDKPLVQEECVENISNLIHCFTELEDIQKFMRCFFQSISQAWFGLDSHRMDKYLMLVRRFLRQILEYLYKEEWETGKVEAICKDLYKSLQLAPIGLNLHLSEIYLEELAKVGRGELKPSTVLEMIKPFADYMQLSNDQRLLKSVCSCLFLQLLRQSDEGIKHQAKFEVWRQLGFPEGNIDVIQEASDDEFPADIAENAGSGDEESDNVDHLDPRAGHVDVYLPALNFDADSIRKYLMEVTKRKDCTTKARRTINFIIKKYEIFAQGVYPLGIRKVELPEREDEEEIIEKTAETLLAEEKADIMEGKCRKKSTANSVGWRVSSLEDKDVIEKRGVPAYVGKWEIETISKKRKSQCDNLVATMKRIKVTLDETLTNTNNINEDMETVVEDVTCNLGIDHNIGIKSIERARKRKKKRNISEKTNEGESNVNVSSGDKSDITTPVITQQSNRKQKKDGDANNWGLENDWEMTAENELNVVIKSSTPLQTNANISLSAKEKPPSGSKNTPAKNVANNSLLNSSKKVSFHLNRNTAQEEEEYEMCLKNSPSVPFDAEKKPRHGVLKPSTVFNPINPFL